MAKIIALKGANQENDSRSGSFFQGSNQRKGTRRQNLLRRRHAPGFEGGQMPLYRLRRSSRFLQRAVQGGV